MCASRIRERGRYKFLYAPSILVSAVSLPAERIDSLFNGPTAAVKLVQDPLLRSRIRVVALQPVRSIDFD
jgi:hypothetical protein